MGYISWGALCIGIAAASGAVAQSTSSSPGSGFSSDGFYIYGYVDLSYFDDGTSGEAFARAEIDLGFAPNTGISSFPIGFSLGVDGFAIEGNQEAALYPALTFGIGANGLVSVGIPRSVVDRGYLPDTVFAKSSLLDLELSALTDSFFAFNYLIGDFDTYGLRYDHKFSNTKVGASYHRADFGFVDVDFYALAFAHSIESVSSFPSMVFFGGLEHMRTSTNDATNYHLGVEGGNDKLSVGLKHSNLETIGDIKTTELFGEYRFTESLSAAASVLHFNGSGSSQTFYGIGLEYSFLNNGYVDASVVDASGGGANTSYEVSVGWRF